MHSSRNDIAVSVAVFAAVLGFFFTLDPLSRPVVLDPATWDYMAISLGEGLIPYRDIFLHKTPGAIFLGAAGAALAPLLGLEPVQAAHLVFVALGALAPALVYLIARRRLSMAAAIAAALFLVAFDQWTVAAVEGVRPKVATVVFGLAAIIAAQTRRPLILGGFGCAATLCWQPGVAFALGALVEFFTTKASNESRRSRGSALLLISLGATLPLLGLLIWLGLHGALGDFFTDAVGFNTHYITIHAQPPSRTIAHLYDLLGDWAPTELLLLPAALLGMALRRHSIGPGLLTTSILYLAMILVNFQAWPDTILLVPLLAVMLASGLSSLLDSALVRGSATVLVALALASALSPHSPRLHPPIDYQQQARFMADLDQGLEADDEVLVVSLPEYLIHTGRRSIWRWPYMWFGVDGIAAQATSGGFTALLDQLERSNPKLMIVARRWSGPLRRRFEQWAEQRYRRERVFYYPHTVRPINVYRRIKNYP